MNSGSAAFSPVGEMTVNALYLQKRILQILIIASQKHTNYSVCALRAQMKAVIQARSGLE